MRREREELRRGIRDFIEDASRELEAIEDPGASRSNEVVREGRPILRLVREPLAHPPEGGRVPAPPEPPLTDAIEPAPALRASAELPSQLPGKKGVCAAYFANKRCWELPEAYCNTALHVCMMRECPVYHLNREELERRFAEKFAHFW